MPEHQAVFFLTILLCLKPYFISALYIFGKEQPHILIARKVYSRHSRYMTEISYSRLRAQSYSKAKVVQQYLAEIRLSRENSNMYHAIHWTPTGLEVRLRPPNSGITIFKPPFSGCVGRVHALIHNGVLVPLQRSFL
jgi:hypothetical protein